MSKCKITLLTSYPDLLSYKAFSGNTIYEMKVCLNIDCVFKLFEIVVLANVKIAKINIHKNKKKLLYFYPFFVFEEKNHGTLSVKTPSIIYFNFMGFMQSKLKELQLSFSFFILFFVFK